MRKFIFIFFILLCSALGALTAFNKGIGLQIFYGSIGAVVGTAIGGALTGIGRRHPRSSRHPDDPDGLAAVQDKQNHNYWLDRGRLSAAPGLPHLDDYDPHSLEP